MLRIVRFDTRRDLKVEDIPNVFSKFQAVVDEIKNVRGIEWCKFFFNGLEIIIVSDGEGYGAADLVDASQAVKKGVAEVFVDFGYAPTKDEFLRHPLEHHPARRGERRRSRSGP